MNLISYLRELITWKPVIYNENIKNELKSFAIHDFKNLYAGKKRLKKSTDEYLQQENEFPENRKHGRHILFQILHCTLRRIFHTLMRNVDECWFHLISVREN